MAAETDPKLADDVTALDGDDTTTPAPPTPPGDGDTETNGGPYQAHSVPNGGPYQAHSEPVSAK